MLIYILSNGPCMRLYRIKVEVLTTFCTVVKPDRVRRIDQKVRLQYIILVFMSFYRGVPSSMACNLSLSEGKMVVRIIAL